MRYNFDELKTQIVARLPDNSSGQITPAVLRGVLLDFVDSVQSASAYLTRNTPQATTIQASLNPVLAMFDMETNNAPLELGTDLAFQQITSLVDAAYQFDLSVVVSGPVDSRITIGLIVDGAPYALFQAQEILPAGNAPVTLTASGVIRVNPAQNLQLGLMADTGPLLVNIESASFLVRLIPSRE